MQSQRYCHLVMNRPAGPCAREACPRHTSRPPSSITEPFAALRGYPWCLGAGDKDANLDRRMAGAAPTQPTAYNIYTLLKIGFNRERIKDGLDCLLQCPWPTSVTEQTHALSACVKRHHPEVAQANLMTRAHVGILRKLLPAMTAAEKQRNKLLATIAALASRVPGRIAARNMYVKKVLVTISRQAKFGGDHESGLPTRHIIFKKSGATYARLPAARKQHYAAEAAIARSAATASLVDKQAAVHTALRMLSAREPADAITDTQLLLSSCRLSPADDHALTELFQSLQCAPRNSITFLDDAQQAPPPIGPERIKALAAFDVEDADPADEVSRPDWLAPMCNFRDKFAMTAVVFGDGPNQLAFKHMFAVQSPYYVSFAPLMPATPPTPSLPTLGAAAGSSWEDVVMNDWKHRFTLQRGVHVPWYKLPIDPTAPVYVLRRLVHAGNAGVYSNDELIPMQAYVDSFEAPLGAADKADKNKTPRVSAELVAKHPWLEHTAKRFEMQAVRKRTPGSAQGREELAPGQCTTDEDLEALFPEQRDRTRRFGTGRR